MSTIFDKFNKKVDVEGLAKDVIEVEKNGGDKSFEEVPHGKYEVKVEKMEIKESKAGDPMFSCWFKIVAGDTKGMIFMNQVVVQDFQIHIVNEMLRALTQELNVEVKFVEYNQYNNLILDIHEKIDNNFEYLLDYNENSKGYKTFKIEEVFVLE